MGGELFLTGQEGQRIGEAEEARQRARNAAVDPSALPRLEITIALDGARVTLDFGDHATREEVAYAARHLVNLAAERPTAHLVGWQANRWGEEARRTFKALAADLKLTEELRDAAKPKDAAVQVGTARAEARAPGVQAG